MKLSLPTVLLILPLLALPALSQADTLTLPHSDQAAPAPAQMPHRGMSMAQVTHIYGTPQKKYPTVGGSAPKRPPITRWDYPGFSVFFEKNTVVDAVVPGHPPEIYHRDQLHPD